jgi:hypothetical protein
MRAHRNNVVTSAKLTSVDGVPSGAALQQAPEKKQKTDGESTEESTTTEEPSKEEVAASVDDSAVADAEKTDASDVATKEVETVVNGDSEKAAEPTEGTKEAASKAAPEVKLYLFSTI